LPVAIIKLGLGRRPGDYGLSLGKPRIWIRWLVLLAAVALPLALLGTRIPAIHAAYPRPIQARTQPWLLIPSTLAFAMFGLGWEFIFRGFLLLGLKPHLGYWAILVQAIPCTLMHMGKPDIEVIAAFPAALAFGALAYRTGSVIPGWLLHLWVALTINLGCVFWPLR
jgi:membrane protease YdiL (CAAX protease family)